MAPPKRTDCDFRVKEQGLPTDLVCPAEGEAGVTVGRASAAIAVAALACFLPVVPVVVASGVASGLSTSGVAALAAVLAAAAGGGKLAAVAAGLVGQAQRTLRDGARAASE